ncbi:MAG: DUF2934 domain-containing protein [Candidatus Omnitrophota bacterium]|nr:DUF2934 domain-containing protein [Candidatus Omnitrophota bacterium]MDZ4243018.1 DUF2934 domain-containing protein [Candidatus Omnitrophota bacterium]
MVKTIMAHLKHFLKPMTGREDQHSSVGGDEFRRMVERAAYDLYLRRGKENGHHREDWDDAERIVREELAGRGRRWLS